MTDICNHVWRNMTCRLCGKTCDGKADEDKLEWDLLPWEALEAVVRVLQKTGKNKYNAWSWTGVPDGRRRYWNAGKRHWQARYRGIAEDKDSGEHPLAHAICDALFIMTIDKAIGVQPIAPPLLEMIREAREGKKEE